MGIFADFRKFALRGNVVDLAVGIIIGAAFTKIVNALVTDILTPPLGLLQGGVPFRDWKIPLTTDIEKVVASPAADSAPAAASAIPGAADAAAKTDPEVASILIGHFLQTVVDFVIVAAVVFLLVRLMQRAQDWFEKKKEEEQAASPPEEVLLLREIRDALKAQKQA